MRMKSTFRAVLLCTAMAVPASAQEGGEPYDSLTIPGSTTPVIGAVRLRGEVPRIDGVPDDAAWAQAPRAIEFTQFDPHPGEPATERTEARVLYGEDAIYVAFWAFDSAPDSVVGQLTRRDQPSYSDYVAVQIDSYFDRRTAFDFQINPEGVKSDVFRFDDTNEDPGWDAVWDGAAVRTADGWTAEFRIPYSQLRFREDAEQTWGINFIRRIARRQEMATWADVRRGNAQIVSAFGQLQGLEGIEPPRRLEITPYSVARVSRGPGDEANPFYRKNDTFGTVGADLKFGVTSDLTLNVTLNPDFGQVDADPAEVNLSAFESFFPERRPFFVEGANLFDLPVSQGDGNGFTESLFYSRRVGRAPQGFADAQGGYVDADDQTTILGAWKLSGKTAGGWSIGVMHAVTAEEQAEIAPAAGGRDESVIEPFTNYGVARVSRDFRGGRTAVGVISTVVSRDPETADALALRSSAYSGGVDFRHRFGGDDWNMGGWIVGSHARGSAQAIDLLQRAPQRWFQRPDADHVDYDPTRTSLSGWAANFDIGKISGGHWRFSTGAQARSPGFDLNDAGFLNETDYIAPYVYAGYDQSSPQGVFRRYRVNLNGWTSYSFGGERYNSGGNINANFQTSNFWTGNFGVNYQRAGLSNTLLRGGPIMQRENAVNGWAGFGTDQRKAVTGRMNVSGNHRGESGSWSLNLSPSVGWRPSGRTSLNVGAFVTRRMEDQQWVGRFGADLANADYLFGELDQTTVGLTARIDYAFTPNLSLQFYAQPFVSAGSYSDFKTVADPRGATIADRWTPVDAQRSGSTWSADLGADGDVEQWSSPDFNFRQFRSNTVLRWEYRPGSALFLVWAQGRDFFSTDGTFDGTSDFSGLFDTRPRNVFLVKFSWWMNP